MQAYVMSCHVMAGRGRAGELREVHEARAGMATTSHAAHTVHCTARRAYSTRRQTQRAGRGGVLITYQLMIPSACRPPWYSSGSPSLLPLAKYLMVG